jgi:hypothetical protein
VLSFVDCAEETAAVRTISAIVIILAGVVWNFSAELQSFVDAILDQKLRAWLALRAGQIGPWALIAGGIGWLAFLQARPALSRWLQRSPLAIIYQPQVHTSLRRRNLRDYHIELRNRSKGQTIADVIVTWDDTPFTRFIDERLAREWLLPPTSIAPSSSVSIFLFSVDDDLRIVENKNAVLGRPSTIVIRASGKGINELTAQFRYEPDQSPKLRQLWR